MDARRGGSEHHKDPHSGQGDLHTRHSDVTKTNQSQSARVTRGHIGRSCCVLVVLVNSCLFLGIYQRSLSVQKFWDATPELVAAFGQGTVNASVGAMTSSFQRSLPFTEHILKLNVSAKENGNVRQKEKRGAQPSSASALAPAPAPSLGQRVSMGISGKSAGGIGRTKQASVLTLPSPIKDRGHSRAKGVTIEVPATGKTSSSTKPQKVQSESGARSQRCDEQDVVSLARCMHAGIPQDSKGFLFVMMGNKAFLPFIYNWLCNTAHMEGVHNRTLFLFTDDGDKALKASRFGVMALQVDRSLPKEYQEHQDYDSYGYWLLVQLRVQVILRLIDADIPFLLCEPDALWVQSPLNDPALRTSADLIGFDDANGIPGFGFLRVRPTAHVKALFHELEQRYSAQMPKQRKAAHASFMVKGEQNILHELIKSRSSKPYKDLKFQMLSHFKYVSGKWYDGGRGGDGRGVRDSCKTKGMPVVINNNWIVGNGPKITRAKRWGHWFLQGRDSMLDSGMACPDARRLKSQIQQMLSTMKTLAPVHGPPKPKECPKC